MSKPGPVVPESVERALESIDCRTCDKADREEEITGLDHARRAIAAAIKRAQYEEHVTTCDTCLESVVTDDDCARCKMLRAEADALEKGDADGA